MESDYLKLKDLSSGRIIKHILGDSYTGEIRKIKRIKEFKAKQENIQKDVFSFGMPIHKNNLEKIIATLEQGGYGWFSVNIYSDPFFGQREIYNSHYDLGADTPLKEQKEKAIKIYQGLTEILEKENYILHILPGPATNPNKINSSNIFIVEK